MSLRSLLNQYEGAEYVTVPRAMLEREMLLPVKGKVKGPRSAMPTFSDLIERFSYKPGYEFTLVHPEEALLEGERLFSAPLPVSYLYLKCVVPDSTKPPHEPYTLQFQAVIPHNIEQHDQNGQLYYLRMILETFELHERDEWLRVDGELVNDPHKKEND
ncbi:hypothetical protein SEA_NOSHOW_69 [Mycobacterium phage NoShow]|nr:hypothetical protein SEA_NOSHOW_69 [Mycobacterium phage NoShow]